MSSSVRRLPRWFPVGGFAWNGTIWLKHPEWVEDLCHERIHLAQQAEIGRWRFLWRYLTSATFRVRAEIPAYMAEGYTLEEARALLFRWNYLWCFPLGRAGIAAVTAPADLLGSPEGS